MLLRAGVPARVGTDDASGAGVHRHLVEGGGVDALLMISLMPEELASVRSVAHDNVNLALLSAPPAATLFPFDTHGKGPVPNAQHPERRPRSAAVRDRANVKDKQTTSKRVLRVETDRIARCADAKGEPELGLDPGRLVVVGPERELLLPRSRRVDILDGWYQQRTARVGGNGVWRRVVWGEDAGGGGVEDTDDSQPKLGSTVSTNKAHRPTSL